MTEKTKPKGRRLSHEILGLLGISFVIALLLFQILHMCAVMIVGNHYADRDILLTEEQTLRLDGGIFNLSLLVSVGFFVLLFLFLLGERLSYFRDIIKGIDALQMGQPDYELPLEGNNELTRLAEAINHLSAAQQQLRAKEKELSDEREQLIRTLSHDIRTPLTSILSYSEYLAGQESGTSQERGEYLDLIRSKAGQIKDLTDILLEGGKRKREHFENGRLLMEQLVEEMLETLEEDFVLTADLSALAPFSGSFDVQELRRIFDNLGSNIRKYADPQKPVLLSAGLTQGELMIRQQNHCRPFEGDGDSHGLGILSIRRIAHSYGGQVEVQTEGGIFSITIRLTDF